MDARSGHGRRADCRGWATIIPDAVGRWRLDTVLERSVTLRAARAFSGWFPAFGAPAIVATLPLDLRLPCRCRSASLIAMLRFLLPVPRLDFACLPSGRFRYRFRHVREVPHVPHLLTALGTSALLPLAGRTRESRLVCTNFEAGQWLK